MSAQEPGTRPIGPATVKLLAAPPAGEAFWPRQSLACMSGTSKPTLKHWSEPCLIPRLKFHIMEIDAPAEIID
jgi:hypothetical protein